MTDKTVSTPIPEVSDVVEAEALAWIAQLNGDDISEKDLAAFREWVQRSPAHQKEIVELGRLWTDLNVLTTMDEAIRQADKIPKSLRKQASKKRRLHRLLVPSAATFALLAVAVVFTTQKILNPSSPTVTEELVAVPEVFRSGVGERQTHALSDGTVITLNTDSFVEVDFTNEQRNLRLIKGEALFTVAHDSDRPFVVFANDGVVRARGTEFSVRLQRDGVSVIVSEGSVELSAFAADEQVSEQHSIHTSPMKMASLGILSAGESAELRDHKASITHMSPDAIDEQLAWRNGMLFFRGEGGLQQVIAEVSRYTDLQIIIDDPELQIVPISIGGAIETGDTDALFSYLQDIYGIVAERIDDKSVRLVRSN